MALLFTLLYALILGALFAYGVNGYVLLWRRRRWTQPTSEPAEAPPQPKDGEDRRHWPDVVVQIPIYNERDVVKRVIAAAGRMEYPGNFEIQVLDDSTDDTPALVTAALQALERDGLKVQHVRREQRVGFKAGALAHGITLTEAELFLILDADFVPEPDFLRLTVPLLNAPDIACVQTRWGHLNRDYSQLTRAQALGIDVHFAVEQKARSVGGWPVAFNGSGGLWRRDALEDAGGWSDDTLTEDLDLSYRAWLRGWRVAYAHHIISPAEIPESMNAFKAQQRRWAHGSTATARKLLKPIWRSRASVGAKIQATLHLTHYAVHPLMLLSALMAVPLGIYAPVGSSWWHILPPLAMATGGPIAMSVTVAREQGIPWRRQLRDVGSIMLLGTGLALSNAVAVFRGWRNQDAVFERTAKGGEGSSYLTKNDRLGIGELACGAGSAVIAAWLLWRGIFTIAPFLVLYAAGLTRVGIATLRDSDRRRSAPAPLCYAEAGEALAPSRLDGRSGE